MEQEKTKLAAWTEWALMLALLAGACAFAIGAPVAVIEIIQFLKD